MENRKLTLTDEQVIIERNPNSAVGLFSKNNMGLPQAANDDTDGSDIPTDNDGTDSPGTDNDGTDSPGF